MLCKISGLLTEADHIAWRTADFKPFLNVIFDAFGEDRLMFGSDWPVCLLAASYEQVFKLVDDYARQLTEGVRAKLFGENAAGFYGLAR